MSTRTKEVVKSEVIHVDYIGCDSCDVEMYEQQHGWVWVSRSGDVRRGHFCPKCAPLIMTDAMDRVFPETPKLAEGAGS
jgi:hypothetical protein